MTTTLTSQWTGAAQVGSAKLASPSMRDWLDLMVRAETLRETHDLELPSVWECIEARQYLAATQILDAVTTILDEGHFYQEASACEREGCDSPLHQFLS